MIRCSCCLKDVSSNEFMREGGLCLKCHKKIEKIYGRGGTYNDVRKFWMEQRGKWADKQFKD